jgi:hypothetical protein
MGPFVRNMHEKNGLLARVRASNTDVRHAEQLLLEIVTGWCPYGAVLCGNSIWQDRKFIDRYMPGFGAYLTYRILDVSSVKVLARTWFGQGAVFVKPSAGEHDALVDVQNSIAELADWPMAGSMLPPKSCAARQKPACLAMKSSLGRRWQWNEGASKCRSATTLPADPSRSRSPRRRSVDPRSLV